MGERTCIECDKPVPEGWKICDACISSRMDIDDDDFDPEGPTFDCAGYYPEPAGEFYCPLWGAEECDWECPHGGLTPLPRGTIPPLPTTE